MKKLTITSIFYFMSTLLIVVMMMGCSGSKSLAKKGNQLEQAGLHTDAANFYYQSLLKNSNNIKARIGLNTTGPYVLSSKLSEFTRARANNDDRSAVYAYLDAHSYYQKLKRIGVNLSWPDYHDSDYENVKLNYVEALYSMGNDFMVERRFEDAEKIFDEIIKLEPQYKNVNDLRDISRDEPIYIYATSLFDMQKYRKAYYQFDLIYKNNPHYKDVAILRNECLNKGQYPVAIIPFDNLSRYRNIEKSVQAIALRSLTSTGDPFLKIIDRANLDVILREQKLNLGSNINAQTAGNVGNLLGAKAMITGSVLTYIPVTGKPIWATRKGFEEIKTKVRDKETGLTSIETTYKPVEYFEHFNKNEVKISFLYKIISLETGEILVSEVVEHKLISEVHYAVYAGEITQLYPADGNGIITSAAEKRNLLNLLRAPRDLKSVDEMASEIFHAFGNDLTYDVIDQMYKQ